MTTTATKVNTKWETKHIQEVTSNIVASTWMAAHQVISKLDQKAQQEFHNLVRDHKITHYKSLNVKTPMDLVRAIAETEHNVYGSDIEISGDANKATLKYNSCGMWSACEKLGKMTADQEKAMSEQCTSTMTQVAKEFGFKFEPKMDKDTYEMTFSK